MSQIILHHYPNSPYAEKIRVAFGIKHLKWRSVQQPMVMPKPDLTPLTGGYRKTPVMQIGNAVFCDTLCILRELERRFPEPSLYPDGLEPLSFAIAYWAERTLFNAAVGVVFAGFDQEELPAGLKEDRTRFLGREFDPAKMREAQPRIRDALRAHLDWLERMIGAKGPFLSGERPGAADLACYHPVWFLRRNRRITAPLLATAPKVAAWADRIRAIGHGEPVETEPQAALATARCEKICIAQEADPDDPMGRRPGDRVQVVPDDYGLDPVVGEIVASSAHHIAIRRSDPAVGEVLVHFPREGFVVSPA